ncbi:MAG: glutamate--tRNA ligase, partial [Candidatus Fonsibacter sp.]
LLNKGHAYRCYCTEDELEEERKKALEKKIPYIYNRKWRDRKDGNASDAHVIRFKSKLEGKLSFDDLVQGKTEVNSLAVEDFIILRKDKKPTYNLSAAVDDYDMKVTHVIRGDDHKINTFKQIQIFESLKWKFPFYAHIPLIHSEEGKKLSKRDYASTVDDYKKIGILPESLRNYLLRLGWSHKDKEIFSLKESIDLFNIKQIGRSPSKLDMQRIKSLNEYYIKHLSDDEIAKNLFDYAKNFKLEIANDLKKTIEKSIPFLKNKAKTLE